MGWLAPKSFHFSGQFTTLVLSHLECRLRVPNRIIIQVYPILEPIVFPPPCDPDRVSIKPKDVVFPSPIEIKRVLQVAHRLSPLCAVSYIPEKRWIVNAY
jgi:hypothetical protein